MFAIIKTGGKQYRVQEGDVLDVEKLPAEANQKFNFSQVLLVASDEETLIGTPFIEKALVRAEVVENFKDEKVTVFKKKRRKQYRRTRGHRQNLTRVKIERIIPDTTAVPAEEIVGPVKKAEEIPAEAEAKKEAVAPKEKPAAAEVKPKKRAAKPKAKPKGEPEKRTKRASPKKKAAGGKSAPKKSAK
jgi:large subunit ribosomal protein L21